MGSMVNTVSQLGLMSSAMRWDSVGGVRIRTNWMRAYGYSSAGVKRKFGFLRDSRKRIAASCFEGNKEGNSVPNKLELEPLWNDEYGTQTVQDYVEIAKEMILRPDGGPPRWFCPIECGCPLKDSPVLLYLPGIDGLGLGLILHHKALGRAFEVRCMHIPVNDRTPIEGLVSFVENAVRLENKSSGRKPIYIVGDSFGGCIALSAAARIPTIDLVVILINPATSYNRSKLQYLPPLLEAVPDQVQTFMPYLYGLTSGNPFKMAVVNTTGSSPTLIMEQVFSKLTAILPHLSDLADIISMDFYVWKLKLLKAAAAKANSHLHAVKAEVLIMASGRDYMFPSGEEAGRLVNSLQNCKMRYFKDNGHALLMEDGFSLLTIIKGSGTYRRKNKLDIVSDFLPPSLSEFKICFDKNLGFFHFAVSPVTYSTLHDGSIVRGLSGVPHQGPVLLVGYHMFFGLEISSLVEAFLKEKNIVVRGMTHPEMFTENFRSINEHVLLYPGGVREALHRKDEHYKLFWPQRPEFVRMAIRFGVTIVPFGVVGADDLMGICLDYDEQMKIPSLREKIRLQNLKTKKLMNRTVLEGEEISKQDFYVPGFYLKKPGRFYFLFGKPIETRGFMESWKDEELAMTLYLKIKSAVEQNMSYLLEKRKQDPYRDIFARAAYRAISNSSSDIPSFEP
ncbi:OLC1v1000697C2 [Oldenlandia corymbosa var. corymbosa]|uniref:OLC1v1000697C2 n=1 Tax=Oldenlandia corymbosa var. corymbosa TaxID=529605 RepID=A0AAV1D3D1_OLDCO|nr:OLC1v1000697C2 [Oldenlandia corymbosa var. corymbosa]